MHPSLKKKKLQINPLQTYGNQIKNSFSQVSITYLDRPYVQRLEKENINWGIKFSWGKKDYN